ncbi:MAG TPA: GNAT family N-acetyltransferase [Symbiobacteriaceae bacterium]|jgi:GNAT superfamily N-acetyltransferase
MVDLIRAAGLWEENQEYLKQCLGYSNSNRFGAHWVLMPDVPFPKFNHASRIRLASEAVDGLITECRAFFRARRLPFSSLMVTPATEPADLPARLYRLGFTSETNPVMLWGGTPIRGEHRELRVEYADRSQSPLLFDLISQVFFPGAGHETIAMGRRAVDISYDIGALNYIAYWNGRPAGAGMLFCREGMGGIYNMCTLPQFRGRGVATAVLAAALHDATRLGCEGVGLTPTAMGRPLYEKLGFREIYEERYFVERF